MLLYPELVSYGEEMLVAHPSKPNLFILKNVMNQKSRFFVPPFVRVGDDDKISIINVKNILFCSDFMHHEISASVIKKFLKLDPYENLKKWLQELSNWFNRAKQIYTKVKQ